MTRRIISYGLIQIYTIHYGFGKENGSVQGWHFINTFTHLKNSCEAGR
uniref:Uncharacterized protein n=1 Tax=Anguilla anguilla TaxID=7936 RepID=A0A0E9WKA6_ANGAN